MCTHIRVHMCMSDAFGMCKIEFFKFNTTLPTMAMLASKQVLYSNKKSPPVEVDLMIAISIV